jgi:hypothetical protein
MLDLLAQAGHTLPVKRALQHQGLHLLYTQYCRREGPQDCPLCGGRAPTRPPPDSCRTSPSPS